LKPEGLLELLESIRSMFTEHDRATPCTKTLFVATMQESSICVRDLLETAFGTHEHRDAWLCYLDTRSATGGLFVTTRPPQAILESESVETLIGISEPTIALKFE